MTTPQMHRIERLEARTEVGRMIAFVAAANGVSPAAVIAEAEHRLRETAGMTGAERIEHLATDLGLTVTQIEDDLAAIAGEFAAWQRERTP